MIDFVIEVFFLNSILLAIYWLLLRKETDFQARRMYLIGTLAISLLIPLIPEFSLTIQEEQIVSSPLDIKAIMLEPIVTSYSRATPSININWILVGYFGISLLLLVKVISSIFRVFSIKSSSKSTTLENEQVYIIDGSESFTFFNWIFLGKNAIEQGNTHALLMHEKSHAEKLHSCDLLGASLYRVFFWWLPGSWFILPELKKIHEYQADAKAMNYLGYKQYSNVLISATLSHHGLTLANSFHDGSILKRLKTMKGKTQKLNRWKLAIICSLTFTIAMVFGCNDQLDEDLKQIVHESYDASVSEKGKNLLEEAQRINPGVEFRYVEYLLHDGQTPESIKQKIDAIDPDMIENITVDNEEGIIGIVFREGNQNNLGQLLQQDEVFTLVEEVPEYPGGLDAFYSYIAGEIKYPEQARKLGVEGKVYVQFVVEKDGTISNVKTLKGIGAGCDGEAMRVLQTALPFKPGKQRGKPVRVRMVLPIVFDIGGYGINYDNTIVIEQMQGDQGALVITAKYSDGAWHGSVKDPDGNLLAGANIVIENTNRGTVSDHDGTFRIEASESDILSVSFVGYESVKLEKI